MKTNKSEFLLIDDDLLSNLISRTVIKKVLGEVSITEFTQPELGLKFLKNYTAEKIVLLLDINMPIMTGWDFLEKFNDLPVKKMQSISIFILTSSIDPNDVDQALKNPLVKDLIQKPFSKEKLLKVIEKNSI